MLGCNHDPPIDKKNSVLFDLGWNHRGVYILSRNSELKSKVKSRICCCFHIFYSLCSLFPVGKEEAQSQSPQEDEDQLSQANKSSLFQRIAMSTRNQHHVGIWKFLGTSTVCTNIYLNANYGTNIKKADSTLLCFVSSFVDICLLVQFC